MQATQLTEPSLKAFKRVSLPEPPVGAHDLLIRMKGATLNFLDIVVARGEYPGPVFPMVPVADGAGVVAAAGAEVTHFKVGDRVIPHFTPRWLGGEGSFEVANERRGVTVPGSLAELVTVPESGVVAMPEHLSFEQAASLPIAGTTAWRALRTGNITAGSTVVLLGTGGVSVMALQLAKACGARVIITSSSDEKLARARELGADETINYKSKPDWDVEVARLTGGRGADLVIETSGEATFAKSVKAVRYGGTVYVVGFVSGRQATFALVDVIAKAVTIAGRTTGGVDVFAEAVRAVAQHHITPVIDKVFQKDYVRAAYEELAAGGRHFGKIALAL